MTKCYYLILAVTTILQWNSTGTSIIGGAGLAGIASNHLNFPLGLVINSLGVLYIADANNNRVQMYVPGNSGATTSAGSSSGSAGSTSNLLNYPNDVAVDSSNNVYVVDTKNHRVQLWIVNASSGITLAGNGKY